MNDAAGIPLLPLNRAVESNHRATATKATARRPVVIVLGTPGSGISLCSRILSTLGVDMVDRTAPPEAALPGSGDPPPDNAGRVARRGDIAALHDRILALFNRAYRTPFHDFALPADWWVDARVAQIRREAAGILRGAADGAPLGFGDPHAARLMPIWHLIAADLELVPKLVLCLRDPAEIVRALDDRDGLDPAGLEYRWMTYITDFFRYVGALEFCVLEYRTWFSRPSVNLEKLGRLLDLDGQPRGNDLHPKLSAIVDPVSCHGASDRGAGAGRPLVRSLYRLVANADRDPSARERIDAITAQFADFQELLRPALRGFETASSAASGRLSRCEREAAGLRVALAERDAALDAANRKGAATEARLTRAEAEIAAQQFRLAQITAERDADAVARQQAEVEAAGVRAALAEGEAALDAANAQAVAVAARLTRAQAEIAAQQSRLTQIAAERDAVTVARQQAEVQAAGLRAALAEREAALDAADAHAAAVAARLTRAQAETQCERREWSAALARADEELRWRIADADMLRAETAALSEQLAAARRVRDATTDALRIYASAAPPPKPLESAPWKRTTTGLVAMINAAIRLVPRAVK